MAFWILAPVMVVAALGILFVRKAVHAALLLADLLPGMEQPPHPMRLGTTDTDYYVAGGSR